MKKTLFALFILHCSLIIVNAQWQPEVMIANNTGLGYPVVSSYGNNVYVFWHDNRAGNFEIYYKLSTDAGSSWSPDTRLTINSGTSSNPTVNINGSIIHLVWQDNSDGNLELYYKRSTDAGINWGSDIRLTNYLGSSQLASIGVIGSNVHIAWVDNRDGNYELYYKKSSDDGINWSTDTRLTIDTTVTSTPAISATLTRIHLIFKDRRSGIYQFYYKFSTDGGNNWSNENQITNIPNVTIGSFSKSQVSDSIIHLLWNDNRTGHPELYHMRSANSGVSWEAEVQLTNTEYSSFNPALSVSGQIVHIACQRSIGTTAEIFYKRSTDGGVIWETETGVANDCFYSALSSSGTNVNLVYIKNLPSPAYIYYKKNPIGNVIGISNISSEIPDKFNIEQNYPNPFNPSTKIKFQIKEFTKTILKVYDALGRELSVLVNDNLNPGTYEFEWNAENYPSGIYFYTLTTENFKETKKMILIK